MYLITCMRVATIVAQIQQQEVQITMEIKTGSTKDMSGPLPQEATIAPIRSMCTLLGAWTTTMRSMATAPAQPSILNLMSMSLGEQEPLMIHTP